MKYLPEAAIDFLCISNSDFSTQSKCFRRTHVIERPIHLSIHAADEERSDRSDLFRFAAALQPANIGFRDGFVMAEREHERDIHVDAHRDQRLNRLDAFL